MHDNKVRLSPDVLEKATCIAQEWGLKNARAAVEAVFRRYADDYLYGREPSPPLPPRASGSSLPARSLSVVPSAPTVSPPCDALDALDDLLGA